ncbi:MAG: hypothetical protein VXX11_03290 [Planctomycetota bacterium]|nr:hypothetical protein [Planctomycetota bacterium]
MSIKSDELWEKYGDQVATVPLGRTGLIRLVELTEGAAPKRWDVDLCIKRVKREGGPSTEPPASAPDRLTTIRFFEAFQPKTKPKADTAISDEGDLVAEVSADNLPPKIDEVFEPLDVDRTLYVYEESKDTYKTFIQQAKGWVTTTGDAHRSIVQWYSNWDGQPVSLNGISRRTGLPRNWVVGYLKAHGITHDSAPFSAEEVAKRGVDELAQDALALKFGALATKTEELGAKETQTAARNWWDFETAVLNRLRGWIGEFHTEYTIPKLRLHRAEKPFWLVTSATDFHWGMYSWAGESGHDYNRKIARSRLMQTTEDLIARLPGQPQGITLAVGSDFFHIDGIGPEKTTTRGTPQDSEGSALEILISGCELQREHIDILSQVAPVTIVLMSGNHDRASSHALLMYLHAVYEGSNRVTVMKDHTLRTYQSIGTTLACFTHGDTAKVKDLGTIMSKERRHDWGVARHHVAFGGHLHHQRVQEIGGIRHYLLPSLASPDAWHAGAGYVTSEPGLMGVLVDMEDGPIGTMFCPVREE